MSDFTYELLYALDIVTSVGFKLAIIYLIIQYLEIRRVKQ